jgi:hypothetical protein
MSAKRLLPLLLLLTVLAISAIMLKRPSAPPRLVEETGFEHLLPSTLHGARITGLDLYHGVQPEARLRLRRQNATWIVASHYDAPARADKVAGFLARLDALQGEVRADQANLLHDFRLESTQALHLQVYVDHTEVPAFHLLAGKQQGQHGFVRRDGESRVYNVALNLHGEAGLYGEHAESPPPAKPWLDLHVQTIPSEHISAVTLQTPTNHWHFVRRPPTSDTAPASPGASPGSWQLAQPSLPFTLKPEGLNTLVSILRALRAEDVVNPAQMATYGLSDALYRAVLTVQPPGHEARLTTLLVGYEVPEQAGKHYARLGSTGPIYVLPPSVMHRVFPKGKELFELRLLRFSPDEVVRVAWQHNGQQFIIDRHESAAWRFVATARPLEDTQALQSVLTTITEMLAEDWLAQPHTLAADQPATFTLDLTLTSGHTEALALRQHETLYYASVKDFPGVFVVRAEAVQPLIDLLSTLQPASK